MTKKRYTIIQDGNNFTVRDNLKNKPMGMFEFKEDEFSVYFCFHKIIDSLNELYNENEDLKTDISVLNKHYDKYEKICTKLRKENEQLKQNQLKKKNELKEAIDRIDSLIHTQEDYLAWSIIYKTLTGGKPLGYRLKM